MLRRSRDHSALFVTDALRRTDTPQIVMDRLMSNGQWQCASVGRHMLLIDPSPALWRRIMDIAPHAHDLPDHIVRTYPFLVSCARRVCQVPIPFMNQPVTALRHTLIRLEENALAQLQDELPEMVAVLQRQHKPLPEAAGHYILYHLEQIKESSSC